MIRRRGEEGWTFGFVAATALLGWTTWTGCGSFGEDTTSRDAGPAEAAATDAGPGNDAAVLSAYESSVQRSKPLVYWRFVETITESLADRGSAGLGAMSSNVVRLGQPSLVKDSADFAVQMVSGDTIVSANTPQDWFTSTRPFSVECWLRLERTPAASDIVFRGSTSAGVGLSFDSTGALRASRYENGVGVRIGKSPLSVRATHHVVATFDGAVLVLYVDGKAEDSQTATTPLEPHSFPITIGTTTPSPGPSPLDTVIDEVAFYDRELPLEELVGHAKAGGIDFK